VLRPPGGRAIERGATALPIYAVDIRSVPAVEVAHPHHVGLRARRAFKHMGITNGRIQAEIHTYSPGGGIVEHQHEDMVHVFYILEGSANYTIGDKTYRARPGTMLYMPERLPHSMKVVGKDNLVVVWFDGPARGQRS
jgi:quercetin dioxygenase-like cupin family protein